MTCVDFVENINSRTSLLFGAQILVEIVVGVPDLLERLFPESRAAINLDMLNKAPTTREFFVASTAP